MLKTSSYNFDEYDGADVRPGMHCIQETASIQQNLSLFLEVMDSLGSDDDVKQNEILREMYCEQFKGMQDKIMLLISKFQDNEEILSTLLDLSDWMEGVLGQYLRRAGAGPSNPKVLLSLQKPLTPSENSNDGDQTSSECFNGTTDSEYDSDESSDSEDPLNRKYPLSRRTGDRDKGKGKEMEPDMMEVTSVVVNVAGVLDSVQQQLHLPLFRPGYRRAEHPGECPVCFEDSVPIEDLFIFDTCEHQYCRECLQGYFANLIEERKVLNITCPHPGCATQIEYHQVQSVVSGEMFHKYEEYTFLAALNTDPTVKWCPKPGCGNAIIGDPENPRCECTDSNCRYEFCFLCSEPWHADSTCDQYQEWKAENGMIDTKFTHWAKKNTKKCPQCKTMIEKIAGCNHMTCSSCKFEFCWLCGGKYSGNHFDVFNVLGCPGMQSGSKQFGVARRVGMRALIGTGLVLGGILGTALAIPAAVVAGPIYGGYKLHQRRKRSSRMRHYNF